MGNSNDKDGLTTRSATATTVRVALAVDSAKDTENDEILRCAQDDTCINGQTE
jgi:hypothetical protein